VPVKRAACQSFRRFSDMQSEKAGDHNDHDHYADDIENIHCSAPIEILACSAAQAPGIRPGRCYPVGVPGQARGA
jgi:hypothetical protein